MKKGIMMALSVVLLLSACTATEKNIVFTAVIESASENSIMITTTDAVGFDKASVGFEKGLKLDFTPTTGQMVELEILPQIRESYPVQVTAVKIKLKGEKIKKVEYKKITPQAAKQMIDSEKNIIILDVRTIEEYNEGHIANSMLIADTDIEKLAPQKLTDKAAKILVYCRSGRRSEAASKKLIEMGYTGILDFGGIIDWTYGTVK